MGCSSTSSRSLQGQRAVALPSFKNSDKSIIFWAVTRNIKEKSKNFGQQQGNYCDKTNFFVHRKQTTPAEQSFPMQKNDIFFGTKM